MIRVAEGEELTLKLRREAHGGRLRAALCEVRRAISNLAWAATNTGRRRNQATRVTVRNDNGVYEVARLIWYIR